MKRPVGVTVVAVLAIASSLSSLVFSLVLTPGLPAIIRRALAERDTWFVFALSMSFFWSLSWAVAGIGLWRLRRWARLLVIVLCLLGICGLSYMYWTNWSAVVSAVAHPAWLIPIALYGSCFGYMFTGGVKRAFSS